MVESSIIKLILIVALNMCFVWVWVKKENLRSFMPFEIIRKLEKISFLKKIKKLISFIGNISINIFWIFNVLYVIVTAKAFEKILDITLGFSYGLKYIEKSIETPFFKVNYINTQTLDETAKFLFDSGNFITLFVGLTGMLVAIYIYAVSIDDKLKKYMLLTLIGKEELFYLSFYIVILFLFRSENIFIVGPIGYLIYLLTKSIKKILKINSESSYEENFQRVIEDVFMGKAKDIKDLYIEVKKSLYKAVKEEELMEIEENKYYFNELLDKFAIDLKGIVEMKNGDSIIRFLYDLYDEVYRSENDNMFQRIGYLHMSIAKYYRKNNDKENFYWALYGMTKKYDYYYRDGTDKFELSVVSGFRYDYFGIYEQYKEKFEEGIEWYSQIFKAITEGIKKAVENEDFYFFQQFIYLIEKQFKHKKELKKDYKLLEKSVYFGILMYLKEEKRKSKDNEKKFEKMDEYIELIEKLLSNNNIIDLIELYEFISEEIYGWNEEYRDRLNWDKYFERKRLIRVSFDSVRTDGEKNNLFFELLGKIKYSKYDEDALLNEEELEECLKFSFKSDRKIKKDTEKSIERIKKFKKNVGYLLGGFKNYKDKMRVTEESDKKTKERYEKIENLFEKFIEKNKCERDEKIREVKILKSKIKLTKTILIDIIKESSIIKMLEGFNKYKLRLEEKNNKIQCLGINEYMEKEFFTEIDKGDGIEFIVKPLGEAQNEGIERIIMNSLDQRSIESEETIEKVLEKVKGKPWIILTGIYIGNFFYDKKGSVKENIIIKSDLDKKYFEKYGEILEGIYKYNGVESPIYNLDSDKEGIYILDSDDIKEFVHYDPDFELQDSIDVKKESDTIIGYASLKITDTKKILEKRKEVILKYKLLQEYESDEEKIKHFKELILIEFNQKGELKLRDKAKVYKVEFNG